MHDLTPPATAVADLIGQIRDDQLSAPTPCADYRLGDLLQHVDALAVAFARAARKEISAGEGPPPPGDAALLPDDWRTQIPENLRDLAVAWQDEKAWSGPTAAGGLEMDAAEAAAVATNELVVHGWDVARAAGLDFDPDRASIDVARGFVELFSGPGTEEFRGDAFGTEVTPPADATALEQLVALNGRDPRSPLAQHESTE